MSQIGQLQSANTLTDSIKGMVLQNQIGSAGNLIGKNVAGPGRSEQASIKGMVNSVQVQNGRRNARARQRQHPPTEPRDRHRRRQRHRARCDGDARDDGVKDRRTTPGKGLL